MLWRTAHRVSIALTKPSSSIVSKSRSTYHLSIESLRRV
nr:MAG TPA: hypothetical protein [Caudoviricetes sp.]